MVRRGQCIQADVFRSPEEKHVNILHCVAVSGTAVAPERDLPATGPTTVVEHRRRKQECLGRGATTQL